LDTTMATAVAAAPTAPVQVASLDPVTPRPAQPVQVASLDPAAAAPAVAASTPAPESNSFDVPSPSPEKLDAKLESQSEASAAAVTAAPVVTTVPVRRVTHLYVQVGAFSIHDNAERLKNRLAATGNLVVSPI